MRVFIVEDDDDIRAIVLYALEAAGFAGFGFDCGADFFHALDAAAPGDLPDLVLLDIMLPGDDGLAILRRLRQNSRFAAIPAIMLTAKGGEIDKIKGLDAGADDYLAKPFGVMELISRIRAVLRRSAAPAAATQMEFGQIALNPASRTVLVAGSPVVLTFKEYELLHYLMVNNGIALSREKITEAVWGYDFEGESRTVDAHIRSLRQKIGPAGEYIHTMRNIGYKFDYTPS
ncbi:MAG: response regulator transcription factor [Defluviitaleaceae bacterium]|nr:response regulator transcription factor [Defluviitaleaceae bacterium]